MKLTKVILAILVAFLGTSVLSLAQESEDALKGRMQERLAEVVALKVAGVVGENNKGFLEQRGALNAEQTTLMNAENADRRALYNILATRLGYSVAVIGEQRAIQIRNNAAAGEWLQAPDGSWYKK